jgi:hypothetical protein
MLDKARASITRSSSLLQNSTTEKTKFQFIQGSAEDLDQTTSLQPDSVDLVTAGMYYNFFPFTKQKLGLYSKKNPILKAQSAHWFDWSKVWPQTHRVLRHGGTAAFWVKILSFLYFF